MIIDIDKLIRDAEGDLAQALSARVTAGIVKQYVWLLPVSGSVQLLVAMLVGQFVKYGDWAVYKLGRGWVNTVQGKNYARAAARVRLAETPADIVIATAAKKKAFDELMGAG